MLIDIVLPRMSGLDLLRRMRDRPTEIAVQNAVFERFFRIPGSDAQGSGLGLAIVRRLAEAIGSSVHLGPGLNERGLSVALSLRPACEVDGYDRCS
jgi:K+-sensing histidine kinase KdpD